MPAGRPTDYTEDLVAEICSQLADGLSLRTICLSEDMPNKATVFKWLRKYPRFNDQYAKAKEESVDALFEEIIDIADDGSNDWMESNNPENPGYRANGEALQRSRLRVDTRKWALSKLKPKKYGDRLFQETKHSGSVGVRDISEMTDEELEAELNRDE
tara:strand:+ start:61 stop:534 length:474 start_codon:yes stop_codon:yes gene_type:complete